MQLKHQELDNRARQILGIPASASQDEIKQAYRKKAKIFHPDITKKDDRLMGVVNQAYHRLTRRKNVSTTLLEDDSLVSLVTDLPVEPIEQVRSYEEWHRDQFYNMDQKSIWPE